jgi:hypothetical protein
MGLFSRFFGGTEGPNDHERRNRQDAKGNSAQSIGKHGAQCNPESIGAADDLAARAKLLVAEIRFEEAEPLLRQSLAILEGACGPDHPRVAEALCDLAMVLQDCDEAETLYRRSLAIAEGTYGPSHPNVVIPLHGMAVALEVLSSRYQEAEPLYRRCLAICEASYGPDDPRVAQVLERIAVALERQSRYEEAEPLYQRSLAIMEGAFGPDHPNVAKTRKELATLSDKSHQSGVLRREGGKKYLRIDGAHAVVHACSTTRMTGLATSNSRGSKMGSSTSRNPVVSSSRSAASAGYRFRLSLASPTPVLTSSVHTAEWVRCSTWPRRPPNLSRLWALRVGLEAAARPFG